MTERKMLTLSGFKGVDLSSAPTMVSPNRASYSINMINDNGINHKRPGWDERFKFGDRINGIYHYVNGEYSAIIVYAGENFYKIVGGEKSKLTVEGDPLSFNDERVQFFPHGDDLYIIGCGDFLVYRGDASGDSLKTVMSDGETYVPTTTVYGNVKRAEQIPPEDGEEDGKYKEIWESYGNGAVIDSPSLITPVRKNKFVGCNTLKGSYGDGYAVYHTDALFDKDGFISVEIERYVTVGGVESIEVTKYEAKDFVDDSTKSLCFNADSECYGIQTYEDWSTGDGKECNVTITFEAYYEDKDRFDSVRKCRFGTVFGAYGNSDRLFLSGNPDLPNVDFYSLFDDFTQFTEASRTVMGSANVPITGYMRLSDSVLATLKADNPVEPTIYYRSATERENSEGHTEVNFTRWAGGINEGCVNPHTVVNLAGDDIFVSPNGVYGVVQIQNTSKNDRYIRQRDMLINAELRKRDLKEAVSFVYQNRYYLSLGNGECYVADPRFKNYLSEDIDGSFNYEWWKWTNVPARVFANVDGEFWFGTDSGLLCRFDGEFCDRTYNSCEAGNILVDKDTVAFNKELDVQNGDIVKISNYQFYRSYLNTVTVKDGWIHCSSEMIVRVYLGQLLYVDNAGESGLSDTNYYVTDIDRGRCLFKIGSRGGTSADIKSGGFNLHMPIGNKDEFTVINVDKSKGTFMMRDEYGVVDISLYRGKNPVVYTLDFVRRQNVCSEWYTPVFDLGASHLHKTLYRLNVTLDPNVRGSLKVGYETNDKLAYIGASVGKAFNFEDFSFNDFSFTTGFTVAQSQKVKARNFNYIMFRFVSDNDKDCAIDNFSAEYTYNSGRFAGRR